MIIASQELTFHTHVTSSTFLIYTPIIILMVILVLLTSPNSMEWSMEMGEPRKLVLTKQPHFRYFICCPNIRAATYVFKKSGRFIFFLIFYKDLSNFL